MPLDKLYRDTILEHNRNARNHHALAGATHSARGLDALCGDDIEVQLLVDQDGTITGAAFTGPACAVTTASASMLTEWLKGRGVTDFSRARAAFTELLADPDGPDHPELGELNDLKGVGHFPARVRNALLPWRTVAAALEGRGVVEN